MKKFTTVVPVYKNEGSIDRLLDEVINLADQLTDLGFEFELVTVVDGSPDQSYAMIQDRLAELPFPCQLVGHSRNFGSFAAIRTGLAHGTGDYFGVLAADLQEPIDLMSDFAQTLDGGDCDVVIGRRVDRDEALSKTFSARLFWGMYRRLIVKEMPSGGVDVFGCSRTFRDHLLELEESRTSLVGLIFWLGFERKEVDYKRQARDSGKSAWTLRKKLRYMADSIFAFTDYPIRFLLGFGLVSTVLSLFAGLVIAIARITGNIEVPGFAALMLVTLTFGSILILGLGLVGEYAWRAYENTKHRPTSVVARTESNLASTAGDPLNSPVINNNVTSITERSA